MGLETVVGTQIWTAHRSQGVVDMGEIAKVMHAELLGQVKKPRKTKFTKQENKRLLRKHGEKVVMLEKNKEKPREQKT